MIERSDRLARNEALFRSVNERVEEVVQPGKNEEIDFCASAATASASRRSRLLEWSTRAFVQTQTNSPSRPGMRSRTSKTSSRGMTGSSLSASIPESRR